MLAEPATSVTDFALGALVLGAVPGLVGKVNVSPHWPRAFFFIAMAALLGGVYHAFIVSHERSADITWSAITVLVAIAITFIFAATVATVLGEDSRAKPLLFVRLASLTVFVLLAILGYASTGTLLITEGLAMIIILFLWAYTWRQGHAGVGLVLVAIAVSVAAGVVRGVPVSFFLGGWEIDEQSLYHVAQMPGLALLYFGLRRLEPGPIVGTATTESPSPYFAGPG